MVVVVAILPIHYFPANKYIAILLFLLKLYERAMRACSRIIELNPAHHEYVTTVFLLMSKCSHEFVTPLPVLHYAYHELKTTVC